MKVSADQKEQQQQNKWVIFVVQDLSAFISFLFNIKLAKIIFFLRKPVGSTN